MSLIPSVTDIVETKTGQRLLVGEWPGDEPPIVFAHGLTSTHRNIASVAASLSGSSRVVAPDLRGRGLSTKPGSGSYGMLRHAEDILAVMDELAIDRAVLAGHSMGAYVATAVAATTPERALGLVLIDGGILMRPPGFEVDAAALFEAVLGPTVQRMRTTYSTPAEYLAFWQSLPYLEGAFGPTAQMYAEYDLGFHDGGYRAKCAEVAAAEDWADLLEDPGCETRLAQVKCPVLAIAAEKGMWPNDSIQVLSDAHLEKLTKTVADSEAVRVPDTNHHTVTLSEAGGAATADAIAKFVARIKGPL